LQHKKVIFSSAFFFVSIYMIISEIFICYVMIKKCLHIRSNLIKIIITHDDFMVMFSVHIDKVVFRKVLVVCFFCFFKWTFYPRNLFTLCINLTLQTNVKAYMF